MKKKWNSTPLMQFKLPTRVSEKAAQIAGERDLTFSDTVRRAVDYVIDSGIPVPAPGSASRMGEGSVSKGMALGADTRQGRFLNQYGNGSRTMLIVFCIEEYYAHLFPDSLQG